MRKWKITTLEPAVDMNQDGAQVRYYQENTVEADEVDTHDGMLLFMKEYDGQDEARFHVRRKELVAGYTISNIISFEEVTDGQTSETPV